LSIGFGHLAIFIDIVFFAIPRDHFG